MPATAPKLGLDGGEQVFGIAVHIVEIAVARDPERVVRDDVHAWKECLQVQSDHVLERHEPRFLRQRDEAGQDRRHLHAREALLPALRIAHGDREVERQVRDVWERVSRVDRERGEHREDLLPEDGVELAQLLLAHLIGADDADARFGKRGDDA